MQPIERVIDDYTITTDPARMDVVAIHDFLCHHSGWSNGIPIEKVRDSIAHSLNFGVFHEGKQIGFARVISDYATIAYLGDVYVLESYRGRGLSKALMDTTQMYKNCGGGFC